MSTRSSQATNEHVVIEFFTVPPSEDDAFLAAWLAAAAPDATLHRALREDVQPRYAALSAPAGPDAGVLLALTAPAADWAALVTRWAGRQGFISARRDADAGIVHWSSPLMYQRTTQADGTAPPRAALYGPGFRYADDMRRP